MSFTRCWLAYYKLHAFRKTDEKLNIYFLCGNYRWMLFYARCKAQFISPLYTIATDTKKNATWLIWNLSRILCNIASEVKYFLMQTSYKIQIVFFFYYELLCLQIRTNNLSNKVESYDLHFENESLNRILIKNIFIFNWRCFPKHKF